MTQNILYSIEPAHPSSMTQIQDGSGPTDSSYSSLAIINLIGIATGFIMIFVNLFTGGYGWLICLCIVIVCNILMNKLQKEADYELRKLKAKEEADNLSEKLNQILSKSEQIANNILPYLESMVVKNLEVAKVDFNENALAPFWDRIEESTHYLARFKEAVDQLVYNSELYKKILEYKRHNFPIPFPIGTNISLPQNILDDYYSTIRKAQTRFEFANIWEHKKTQKILVEGFKTLDEAINNMSDAIVVSISDLKHSLSTDFRDLKNAQIEQIKSFENGQRALNETLTSMDNKLYYLQYKKKPLIPFIRP